MNNTSKLLTLVLIIGLSSCYDKLELESPTYSAIADANYIREGQVMEYRIDSTYYYESVADSDRTSTIYIKEEVIESSFDAEGNTLYVIQQSRRYDTTQPYQILNAYYYRESANELIAQKNNAPLLLITAPMIKGVEWNATKYTNTDFIGVAQLDPVQKVWNSEILKVDSTYTPTHPINGSTKKIDSVTYIQLADINDGGTKDYTDRINFKTAYAKDIGMVYALEEAYVKRASIVYRRGYKLEYHLIRYE